MTVLDVENGGLFSDVCPLGLICEVDWRFVGLLVYMLGLEICRLPQLYGQTNWSRQGVTVNCNITINKLVENER